MDLATGALGVLLLKLRLLLQDEYNLQKGAKKDIVILSEDLERIHAALIKVGVDMPSEQLDGLFKIWARDITELSYDMEDVVDTFLVRVDDGGVHTKLHKIKRLGEKAINLFGIKMKERTRHQIADGANHQIADEIKELKSRIKEVAERRDRYKFFQLSSFGNLTTGTVDPRLPALYINERELVGIDEARAELVGMLAQGDDERQDKIVSIVGMGGLGKTTLAKAVYNSLEAQFDCSSFVSVSQQPDLKKILMAILLDLDEAKYCMSIITEPMDKIIDEIRTFLKDRRYFVVIDDLWESNVWKMIRYALPMNNCGSRVITTTRSFQISTDYGDIYYIKPLSDADSENLFYKIILKGEGRYLNNQLAELSDKILKKCGGLPLAIITVASVLASKPLDKWSEVYNSIASGHESNQYVENMRMVLSTSYYDLPSHLKACLLHLSVFPEDCWIEKDLLIWMWIAEGFVQANNRMSLFEQGERYFNQLTNRSLIQIVEDHFRGRVYGCRVHPAVFSLIPHLKAALLHAD